MERVEGVVAGDARDVIEKGGREGRVAVVGAGMEERDMKPATKVMRLCSVLCPLWRVVILL